MSASSRFPTREEVLRRTPRGVGPGHPRFAHEFSVAYRRLSARRGRNHVVWRELCPGSRVLRKDDGSGD